MKLVNMLHAFGEVELLSIYTSMKLGLGKKTGEDTHTMETPHHLMAN